MSRIALLLCLATLLNAALPNVIVLLVDDSGWGDYSINGNKNLQTVRPQLTPRIKAPPAPPTAIKAGV